MENKDFSKENGAEAENRKEIKVQEGKSGENTENTGKNDEKKVQELFRLPKNIRQIGKEESKRKLYIEDYVLNLMKQMSKRSSMEYQMAVLLGHAVYSDGILYLFVKGAVEVHRLTLDGNDKFTGDTWSGIYSQVKQYFQDLEVVGWFLTKPGLMEVPDLRLIRIHERNFQGKESQEEKGNEENKCLLLYDSLEERENYFIYDHNRFKRAHGYYIYYERNQDMQEYLIAHNSNLSIENGFEDIAVKKLRQAMLKEVHPGENEGNEEKKYRKYRKPQGAEKSGESRKNIKRDSKESRTDDKSGKAKLIFASLFILFICIAAAKWNHGENWNTWKNTGGRDENSVSFENGQEGSREINGWVIKGNGGKNVEEEGESIEGIDKDTDAALPAAAGFPEIPVLSGGVDTGDKLSEKDMEEGTGSDKESGTGSDGESGTGSNEGVGTGNNGENGTGSDGESGTGSDGEGETGSDGENGTGSDGEIGTGSDEESGTGSDGGSGTEDGEEAPGGQEAGTEEDSGKEDWTGNNEEAGSPKYYTVKKGDSLASISLMHYHTILKAKAIQDANNIEDPDLIYIGQELIIP